MKLIWGIWAGFDFVMAALAFWWVVQDKLEWWYPSLFLGCGMYVVMKKFPDTWKKFVDVCEKEKGKDEEF